MPPKKAAAAKKTGATASHPPYLDMIKEAVVGLKEKGGSSRQALKKYVQANNALGGVSDTAFTTQFNRALQKGSDSGVFARPKGTSGPVKLAAPSTAAKPATKTATAAKPKETKPATKKAPAKKAAAKKTTTAKKPAAAKKTATKSKANTSKVRKTPAAAPAVEEKPPVVLGKTKSGRVTKSKAPNPEVRKTIAPKKARKAPAKKATPKKA